MSAVTRIFAEETVELRHPSDQVWAVLSDVDSYVKWWPLGLSVSVSEPSRNLLGTEIRVRPWLLRPFWVRFEETEGEASLRVRFFGGALEGPGYVRVNARGRDTAVSGEIDVFARGFGTAMLSLVLPLRLFHAHQLRRVLRGIDRRVKELQREAARRAVDSPERRAA